MTQIGRLIALIAAVMMVVGAAVFLFFRPSIASESVTRFATAVGTGRAFDAGIAEIEAGRANTPLVVQPAPGSDATVTFLVRSTDGQVPRIVSDITGWGESPDDSTFDLTIGTMTPLGSRGWYRLETRVAPRARVEYLVVHGETDYRVDPNNPRRAWSRGGHDISEFVTPDYQPPRELADPPAASGGRTVEATIDSRALDGRRRVLVYLPRGYRDDGALPVAVFHSGWGVAREGQAPRVLDWLIAEREIGPIVGAFERHHASPRDLRERCSPVRCFAVGPAPRFEQAIFGSNPCVASITPTKLWRTTIQQL